MPWSTIVKCLVVVGFSLVLYLVPYRTVYVTLSHPPAPMFHGRYLDNWSSVGAEKSTALETSRRELSEDVSFGIGTIATLVVVDKIGLGKRTQGGRD